MLTILFLRRVSEHYVPFTLSSKYYLSHIMYITSILHMRQDEKEYYKKSHNRLSNQLRKSINYNNLTVLVHSFITTMFQQTFYYVT